MRFVCDASAGKTWFQIETEAEAEAETMMMRHSVSKYFSRCLLAAKQSYRPPAGAGIERDIGLKSHIARAMPLFVTLRAGDGEALATAMLPNPAQTAASGQIIIVGPGNSDPYLEHSDAIAALALHVGYPLPHDACYPY
jgi:hypothetical protein